MGTLSKDPKTKTSKGLALTLAFLLLLSPPGFANHLIQGENIESGEATFEYPDENTFNVHQTSDKLVVGYQSFSTTAGEIVNFFQPSSASSVWNRVSGGGPSEFLGSLNANGQVGIENVNGIIFGMSSVVNVGSLIASTLHLSNENFLAGNFSFEKALGRPSSFVVNQGRLNDGRKCSCKSFF